MKYQRGLDGWIDYQVFSKMLIENQTILNDLPLVTLPYGTAISTNIFIFYIIAVYSQTQL